MRNRVLVPTLAVAFVSMMAVASRADVILFDGSAGTRPDQQGWVRRFNPLYPPGAQTAGPIGTTLDSTGDMRTMDGYFTIDPLGLSPSHPGLPALDRAVGFTVSLDMLIEAESHASPDRAGFSLIVIGADRKGIELGFWTDRIWAQDDDPIFTQAEGRAWDTTVAARYDLAVAGDGYRLLADGVELFSGAIRDYSAFGSPYTIANLIFAGDNTTSASGRARLDRVAVLARPVPEPSSWILLGSGLAVLPALFRLRGRRTSGA
jgi:hypothetical protein